MHERPGIQKVVSTHFSFHYWTVVIIITSVTYVIE